MAKFYGTLIGQAKTEATRRGSESSGIRASVQSWDGSCISSLRYNQEGELIIDLSWNDGSSCYGSEHLFSGTIDELRAKLKS